MNIYQNVNAVTWDTGDTASHLVVSGRSRLRMLLARAQPGVPDNAGSSIQFLNGESGDIHYQVGACTRSITSDANVYAATEPIDMGQHGILFPDGIWAEYTQGLLAGGVWCGKVTLIYS